MLRALVFGVLWLGGCGREVEIFQPHGFERDSEVPLPEVDGGFFQPPGDDDDSEAEDPLFRLGQALFFDRELSGNRNIACATCHVPFLQTTEAIPLSIGQGGEGLGMVRHLRLNEEGFAVGGVILPRNTTDLFNRVEPDTRSLFWDGRVELVDGVLHAPVSLPAGIQTLLQAQAILPLLDRDEMRGQLPDVDVFGQPNELGLLSDDDPQAIWDAILQRLVAHPTYNVFFQAAFPFETGPTIAQVAKAIEFFETTLWNRRDTRFDEREALTEVQPYTAEEEQGRTLFFGEAGCATCHSGALLSDQEFHNIGVPQLGPGKNDQQLDEGRFLVTDDPSDRFAFRTPPLRNVRLTGPYMHNGAFASLDAAVRHHLDPEGSLRSYEGFSEHVAVHDEPATITAILETLSPQTRPSRTLDENEISAIIRFLHTLDSRSELGKGSMDGVPVGVPSGLPVDFWPGGSHPSR